MNKIKKIENTLFCAWASSFVATIGSLYFSEVLHFEPCNLCWYQRILMYPLVIILGIAVIKKDYKIGVYSFPIASIGSCIAFYHYLIQKVPSLSTDKLCGRIPCTGDYINWFGFITIPLLALLAFLIICICSFILFKEYKVNFSHFAKLDNQ